MLKRPKGEATASPFGLRLAKNYVFASLSIGTTLPIENSAVCARLSGTLASGLYKIRGTCPRIL